MTASATWTPRPAPRTAPAAQVVVATFDGERYEILPNVKCLGIQNREGANPPTARFSYITDDRARAWGWPTDFETILKLSQGQAADGNGDIWRYIARPQDRIVALLYGEGDSPNVLFDGYATAPQADLQPSGQQITFAAQGVASRLWDEPIHEVLVRDAGQPTDTSIPPPGGLEGWNVRRPLRARFNPDGIYRGLRYLQGNCTAEAYDVNQGDDAKAFPCFIDPTVVDEANPPRRWTLDGFARYLLGAHNGDQEFVDNPDLGLLKDLLRSRRPREGRTSYNPADASTYDETPVVLPEIDATGHAWPEVLNERLAHCGFAMCFRCETDAQGKPWNHLDVYRKDGAGPFGPKSIPFQQVGETLDVNKTQIASLSLTRDFASVFNGVIIGSALSLYEIAVILAPGFVVLESDAASPQNFSMANLMGASPEMLAKYREWICCEVAGKITEAAIGGYVQGHMVDATPLDFKKLWGGDGRFEDHIRFRAGRDELVAKGDDGKPLKSRLSLSKDYAGPVNAFWDGSGAWQDVAGRNGWELLKDRLGIRITVDPEGWSIGQKTSSGSIGSPVKLVTATAKPNEANPTLFMRLTTVIEADARASKPLPRRTSSPLRHTRYRYVEAGNDYRVERVHKSSPNFDRVQFDHWLDETGEVATIRDDELKADVYAFQVQAASDAPPLVGTVTIPWIHLGYRVGDQISEIKGRDLSLQVNAMTEQGEAPRYPYVVGLDWNFEGGQSTVLHLSDQRPLI